MWDVLSALDRGEGVKPAVAQARTQFGIAQQQLGEAKISRGTVMTDAAIVVFREGLEAVLILAAITGILAIVVLLVVTNWFFRKVYWSPWIARFNRRRKVLSA
jgi:hypothetical protein